jgi:hypothetical protein
VIFSLLWVGSPIVAASTAIVAVIAVRVLGWTRAFIVGNFAGVALTVAIELWLFWFH